MVRASSTFGGLTAWSAFLLLSLATVMSSNCEAQNNPVVKVHAYQREVVGGIPGGPPGVGAPARQTQYLIYLETPPNTELIVEGVWMEGQFHAVETAVRNAPVRFESPVKLADDSQSIAVPATNNTVTEIAVKDPVPGKPPDGNAAKILGGSKAAVLLRHQGQPVLVPVDRFDRRDPLYRR
jgi:hypothetical protein